MKVIVSEEIRQKLANLKPYIVGGNLQFDTLKITETGIKFYLGETHVGSLDIKEEVGENLSELLLGGADVSIALSNSSMNLSIL